MSLSQLAQLQRLLGDVRGHTWDSALLTTRLSRTQAELAEVAQVFEKRALLTLTSGTRTYALPSDHLQTFALVRNTAHVALRLFDSAAVAWWLKVSSTGTVSFQNTAPTGAVLLASSTVRAIRLQDSGSTFWYVYPSTGGVVTSSTVNPGGTIETRSTQLRDGWGTPWYLAVSTGGVVSAATTGTSIFQALDAEVTPMIRLEPEGLAQVDPRRTTGAPRYWAVEGVTLVIDPTPDQSYEAEQWYYTTDSAVVDASWSTPGMLRALAQLVPQSQGLAAAQAVQSMADLETAHLARLGQSDERDAIEALRQPAR